MFRLVFVFPARLWLSSFLGLCKVLRRFMRRPGVGYMVRRKGREGIGPVTMNFGDVDVPEMAWDWISFKWSHDVPFDAQYLPLGFCLRRTYESVYDVPWEDYSPDGLGWEMGSKTRDSYQMLYPILIGEDYVLGRTDNNPTARLGRHCKLGEVVEERFCVLTGCKHPKTFQSALFDSGYVSLFNGYPERKDGSPMQLLLFHVDEPDKIVCPVIVHDCIMCVGCRRPQQVCNCMFKLVVAKNYSMSTLWEHAQSKERESNQLPPVEKNWLSYRSFHLNHLGISFFVTLKFNLGGSCNDKYTVHWYSQYEVFNSGSRFEKHLTNYVQRVLGRSSVHVIQPKLPELEEPTAEGEEPSTSRSNVLGTVDKQRPRRKRATKMKKTFTCQVCHHAFPMKHHLQVHISSVHEKRRDYPCDQCNLSFVTDFKRQRHVRCVHFKERPYACPLCEMSFFQRSDLTRHTSGRHKFVETVSTF